MLEAVFSVWVQLCVPPSGVLELREGENTAVQVHRGLGCYFAVSCPAVGPSHWCETGCRFQSDLGEVWWHCPLGRASKPGVPTHFP